MSEELVKDRAAGELERSLYNFLQWNMLGKIIEDPEGYYYKRYRVRRDLSKQGNIKGKKSRNREYLLVKTIEHLDEYGVKETVRKMRERLR